MGLAVLLLGSPACTAKTSEQAQAESKPGAARQAGDAGERDEELTLDIPVEFTGAWIARIDGRRAVIHVELSHHRDQLPVQLRRKLPADQALGAQYVERRLACLDSADVDLGSRLPVEFTPAWTLRVRYVGGSQKATVRTLSARCEDLVLEVELDLPVAIEAQQEDGTFGVVLVGEAAKVGGQLRREEIEIGLSSEEFKAWDDAIARAVHEDLESLRGQEEERSERKLELERALAKAATPAAYWPTSGPYTSWRVPSADVELALHVRREIGGRHLLRQIYALHPNGQVLRASKPLLYDDDEFRRETEDIGTIDLDGDGNEELLLWIRSYHVYNDETENEMYGRTPQTWFGLLYYDREDRRFEGVRLAGHEGAGVFGARLFDHP